MSSKPTSVLTLPDLHYPENIDIKPILKMCKAEGGFDKIVFLGDAMDMTPFSHWVKNMKRTMENKRIADDYKGFNKDILEPLARANPDAEFIYILGNHENWAEMYVEYYPQLEGLVEPQHHIKLKDGREITWVEFSGIYSVGRLNFIHGTKLMKYVAYHTALEYGNVLCGHTHRLQSHAIVNPSLQTGTFKAESIGCLCKTDPDFMKRMRGAKNDWAHAFNVAYVDKLTGLFNDYTIIINDGQFIFNGKKYK